MEALLVIIGVTAMLIVIGRLKTSVNRRFDTLQEKIDLLAGELRKARKEGPAAISVGKIVE